MRDLERDVLQVVFPRTAQGDRGRARLARRGRGRGEGVVALGEEATRDRAGSGHFVGHAFGDELAAGGACFGTHLQEPVAGLQHVQVMLDHDQRVAGFREAMQEADQTGDVLAVQARRRLVEQQQGARLARVDLRKVTDELESLGFAAGERRERLAHREVAEADLFEAGELGGGGRTGAEELPRLGHRHREQVADGLPFVLEAQHLVAETFAVAGWAGERDVGDELHLHRLPAGAAATFAAALAGVEGEVGRREAGGLRFGRIAEQRADRVPGADVERRIRARGAGRRGLVDEGDLGRFLVELHPFQFRRFVARFRVAAADDLMEQRGLAGARDAAEADEASQRDRAREVAEVVDRGAADPKAWRRIADRSRHARLRGASSGEPVARGGILDLQDALRDALVEEMAAFGTGARADLDEPVRRAHDGFVVLDDHDRVALVDEAAEDADHAREVAGVHADARFVQDEDRVREAGAEAGGQVDALHFAAGQRAREAIQREVTEADRFQIAEAGEDGFEGVVGRVTRVLRRERREHRAQVGDRRSVEFGQRLALPAPEKGFLAEAAALALRA